MNNQPLTLFSNSYRRGKKTTKQLTGSIELRSNHDGSTNHYVYLDLDRTTLSTHRIPLNEGDMIWTGEDYFYIEAIFLSPATNKFILAVTPTDIDKEAI